MQTPKKGLQRTLKNTCENEKSCSTKNPKGMLIIIFFSKQTFIQIEKQYTLQKIKITTPETQK